MQKRKLAIIVTHPIQYYAPVFKLLTERGNHEVKVFYTWGEGSLSKFDPGFGKKIEWDLPVLEGYNYEFLKNTSPTPGSHHFKGIINPDGAERINAWQPDAMLFYGWSYQSHLKFLRQFSRRKRILFRGDSNLVDTIPGWKNILRSIILKWVYSHVDTALYVGSSNKAYYRKYGLKDKQLLFAPHAIDNERFAEDRTEEVLETRESLGLSSKDKLILFAGKFESKKNPLLLIEAFSKLQDPYAHILFVGNGELENELKSLQQSLECKKRIHFMDFQNQSIMPVIYQACDLFCLPSQGPGETWGLAVNEAMASGKAIVVSDKVGCASDLVKPEINGFIFESGNLGGLTSVLERSLTRFEAMGKASKEIIKDWTFLKQAESIEEAIAINGK